MYQRSVLDNQLRVLTSTMPHTRSVSIMLCVGAGSRYESPEMAGVSHFLEHLPFKGTRQWPTAQAVSEAIEGVGGIMNASTDREMTVFWCKVAAIHVRKALSVMLDMVINPRLEPEEVEKEREVIQEELRMTYDHPTYWVDLLIDEALWPDQAMGRDVGGTPETVEKISQESIRDYMLRQYTPANTVLAVPGMLPTKTWCNWLRTRPRVGGPSISRWTGNRWPAAILALWCALKIEGPTRPTCAWLCLGCP